MPMKLSQGRKIQTFEQQHKSSMTVTEPETIEEKIASLRKTIPKLHWGRLRFIGSLRVLSVSYIIGIAVALPNIIEADITQYLLNPWIVWPIIIFLVGVSVANLFYYLFCPAIVRKFESLSDFYEHQLGIKKLQMETYSSDPFHANLLHVSEQYIKALGNRGAARIATFTLYIVSFLALLLFAFNIYGITLAPNCT